MLELTLKTEFVPGTNVSGELACADWRFLLPSLELEEALCLGIPAANTAAVLSKMCGQLTVVSTDRRRVADLREEARRRGLSNVQAIAVEKYEALPFPSHGMDLVWIVPSAEGPTLARTAGLAEEVERLLRRDGSLYFETRTHDERIEALGRLRRASPERAAARRVTWQTPSTGEMRTALPEGDDAIARYFFRHVLFGLSFKKRMLSRLGAMLSTAGLLGWVARRRGVLLTDGNRAGEAHQPPHYLASLAKLAGIDWKGRRCGFSARGQYNSNKVVFYLFRREEKRPEAIVKMTRAAEFNFRLANEAASLSALAQKGYVERGTYPELLFYDNYQGHAVLAQKAIEGEPFRRRTKLTPACRFGSAAVKWITRLGQASASRNAATAQQVGAGLRQLLVRFNEIYRLPETESRFLEEQVNRIERAEGEFPLVFQHGDPGTWNLLVDQENRVVFLDWESGEQEGMPLWDLCYFLRSFGMWAARRRGQRDRLENFQKTFLAPTPWSRWFAEATREYCRAVGLDRNLAEPLFYLCWMHRALKEATRLKGEELREGEFVQLLRLCIRERNGAGLARLFDYPAAAPGKRDLAGRHVMEERWQPVREHW